MTWEKKDVKTNQEMNYLYFIIIFWAYLCLHGGYIFDYYDSLIFMQDVTEGINVMLILGS
jgi:hypothetical protein